MTKLPDFEGWRFSQSRGITSFARPASWRCPRPQFQGGQPAEAAGARCSTAPRAAGPDRCRAKNWSRAARLLADGEARRTRRWRNRWRAGWCVRSADDIRGEGGAPILPQFMAEYPDCDRSSFERCMSIDREASMPLADREPAGFVVDRGGCARCALHRGSPIISSAMAAHHPMHLAQHRCLGYAYLSTPTSGATQRRGNRRACGRGPGVNNGEALMPALLAGSASRSAGLHRRRRIASGESRWS